MNNPLSTLLICLFFMIACTKEIEMEIPLGVSQPVVYALLNPNSNIVVKITRTTSISDTTRNLIVENAQVAIRTGDRDSLVPLFFNDSLSAYSTNLKPISGVEYHLHIQATESIEATTIIPDKPVLSDYEIEPYTLLNEYNEIIGQLSLTFMDKDASGNYYELMISEDEQGQFPIRIFSPDPVITREPYYSSALSLGYALYDALLFNDQGFNLTEKTLLINFNTPIIQGENTEISPGNIYISLKSVSKDYYLYKTSLYEHLNNREHNIFYGKGEPQNVYSNIKQGHGVFAAYNSFTIEHYIERQIIK